MSEDTTFLQRAKEGVKKRPKAAAGVSIVALIGALAVPMQEAMRAKAQANRNSDRARSSWQQIMDQHLAIHDLSNRVAVLERDVEQLKARRSEINPAPLHDYSIAFTNCEPGWVYTNFWYITNNQILLSEPMDYSARLDNLSKP